MNQRKFVEDNKTLEDALCNATLPGEEEFEDTACLDRSGMIVKINELERRFVGAACHNFNNAVEQLKVVNLEVELSVEGIHYLMYVENGVLVTPPKDEEDDGHVENARVYTTL
jgi:hypothetical protein